MQWLRCVLFLLLYCFSLPVMALRSNDVECLAAAMHKEASGEGRHGQEAVALVVLNRAFVSKKSICSVVKAKGQFSWYSGSIPAVNKSYRLLAIHMIEEYNRGTLKDFTNGATYFVHKRVRAKWLKHKKVVYKHKHHVFYKDK